jgi:PAS domain S-box-containing protein
MVSAITAVTMIKEIPKAADLKSPAQLQEIIDQKTAELKAANLELEKSKEVFKKISETNPDVIIRLNEDYKHLFVNKSIVKYSNLSPDTYIGKNYKDLNYTDEVRFFLESNITEALERNATVRGKIPFVDYNQSELMHEVVFVPLETPKGEKKEILTISRDITEEEKAKEALDQKVDELNKSTETLKQHNQQLEDFSYIVSHNLRSPVGNLLALHELYDAEESEQEKGFLFGTIKKVVVSLQQTIDDLTEIINIRLNKQIKVNPLKFSAAINKLSSTLETEIAKKDASIVIDLEEDYVLFNKAYLESIIQNLFTNALKYSDKKRKPIIKFTSKREHGFIALTCEDNGLGIDLTRHRDKIFKLHKTFHDNDDARGVGLFITKNQIEAFGGSIRVESEVGKGTKFILLFKADG